MCDDSHEEKGEKKTPSSKQTGFIAQRPLAPLSSSNSNIRSQTTAVAANGAVGRPSLLSSACGRATAASAAGPVAHVAVPSSNPTATAGSPQLPRFTFRFNPDAPNALVLNSRFLRTKLARANACDDNSALQCSSDLDSPSASVCYAAAETVGSRAEQEHLVVVDPFVARHLRPHQRAGVQWMYECLLGLRVGFNGKTPRFASKGEI